ncbi:hypothetical protein [Rickettsiales endosymbiont of Stachyamoeba lipophora]|uniref:hypothetical protein n=1 Tax=Rickettsiales endosymbiont of Stachyamoeba lipophora TaxID=2486578 RepID=UPI000F653B62|nr:hypothetical protein [Rickettsiales endosymbiont of Stachyamoeba lipophora]AZL15814.1 hypothetical protein EF513_04550 [Rickettsiales endosymbiont of Stachyamoeba lipophora]
MSVIQDDAQMDVAHTITNSADHSNVYTEANKEGSQQLPLDVEIRHQLWDNSENVFQARHDIIFAQSIVEGEYAFFSAGDTVYLINSLHNSKLEVLVSGKSLSINKSLLNAKEAVFIGTPYLIANNSHIDAPNIYISNNCIYQGDSNLFGGEVHRVASDELEGIFNDYVAG